ncbi:MAG: putative LPS assembly protein LptD [Oligoflexia bacterium]|nr:putative LPS assembly protein LptD [Oligoflexia bacterium]
MERSLSLIVSLVVSVLSVCGGILLSQESAAEEAPIHASGDKEIWNRALNKVELIGHAQVHQPGELLSADYIELDQNLRTVDAHGNCIYIANDSVIFGEEMHFNLDTRTGTVISGRVANDKFTLSGERINKLGPGRFQTHWGDYSTCRDCSQSWTISARDVDMEIDGYAYMDDVRIKVKDESALWIPYLVLPMKTRRQTGFLFPEYTFSSNNGFMFVEPFFWAINPHADMTIGLGRYTGRGDRVEWEGRYALTPRSQGKLNFNYLNDQEFINPNGDGRYNPSGNPNRWTLQGGLTHEFTPNLEAKVKLSEVSDNLYPYRFNDFVDQNEQFLTSSVNFAYSSSDIDANLGIYRFRDLLNINPDPRQFDSSTVQAYPSITATTRDRFLFHSPIATGLSVGLTNFTREDGPFDYDSIEGNYDIPASLGGSPPPPNYRLGIDPIRKATRFSFNPSLYTVIAPVEGVSIVPSFQYFGYFYDFHNVAGVPNLTRGYALAQLDLVTQFERIYDTEDPTVPRRKHLIRPILTYDYIPTVQDDPGHPFVEQMAYANRNNLLGYNFDDLDIIPLDTVQSQSTYFTPLGNSLTYGFKTQVLNRRETLMADGKPNPNVPATYSVPFELTATDTFNLYEYRQQVIPGQKEPFTRAQVNLLTNYNDRVTTNTQYIYDPTLPGIRSAINSSVTWIWERAMHQRILAFDRSLIFSYNWNQLGYNGSGYHNYGQGTDAVSVTLNFSLSDYLRPSFSYAYDFEFQAQKGYTFALTIQSPSQCWEITTGLGWAPGFGHSISPPSFALNLVGTGFEGVNEVAAPTTAVAQ